MLTSYSSTLKFDNKLKGSRGEHIAVTTKLSIAFDSVRETATEPIPAGSKEL